MKPINQAEAQERPLFQWQHFQLGELMFCLCLISVFLPVKIYPLIFLMASFVFFRQSKKLTTPVWLAFLGVFSLYALFSFLIFYDGSAQTLANIIKLLVNFTILYFAVNWLAQRDNSVLLKWVDLAFHFIFLLVFAQLLVYHFAFDFRLLMGSSSSGQASALYNQALYFWGLEDKNMFGARIAMLGFPYLLIPLIRWNRVSWWRICGIFLLAFLSLSRTPIVALIIAVFFLVWITSHKLGRFALVVALAAALPFVLEKLIRVKNLTATNDGMGIRLVYWESFFENFLAIPPLGIGFSRTPEFLQAHAAFYRGEPHIHNTFMHNYLELGIVGFAAYLLFLIFFFREGLKMLPINNYWIMAALPLLSIMMILYTGYDNDIVLYLALIFLLGSIRTINFNTISMGI